ncbi:glucose 1-dehydrogenase [Caballeronia sp. NK8]|uniref:SDR family NAD(P)-dependent oxidoreductase n=1 Tax=Caballeronia sp. NK8 TaxID=140098 RepID=UPI001BB5ACC3|nr:SDR family NAD(P)-dependent oxidoreductase [Caballeronia sp. NK8]BCQ26175.1 glucose 1-dehydrogenase [Caballeronia sp. NK8]
MSESRLLEGKVAVISGAASPRGIGMATARMFAKHGAKVVILDLDAAAAREAASSIGPEHRGYVCDVTDRAACGAAVDSIVADLGTIDILINNAGITQALKLLDIDSKSWDRILDVNLRGVLYLSQAVVPVMKRNGGGSIGCMSSVSAQRGGGILGGPHYSAAKAGVLGLAKAMAREFGIDGIRVNCVTPGLIQTDINAGKISDEKRVEILAGIPLNRLGVPDDVAGAFLFLSAPISSYITGAVIDVNGGMLIHG